MGYLLDTDLDKARESLAHIQRASESALEELRLTVGLLRQPGDKEPTEPAGGLGRLDELIDSFAVTGLRVTCDVTGLVRQLPEAVDLTAYRVIQESLTNTAKHAHASVAEVEVAVDQGMLRVCVRDDGRGGADSSRGSGLTGLRDRVEAIGGRISLHSPPGAGTALKIALPLDDPAGAVGLSPANAGS